MNKTILKQGCGIFGMFILAILLLSCPDNIQHDNKQDKVVVSFSVIGNMSRSVLPQVSLADVVSYNLLGGVNGASESELLEFTNEQTLITMELEPGIWNFTLNAYNESNEHILQGKVQNKQITLTGPNQVSFSLDVLRSGNGNIHINIIFPEEDGITRVVANGDITSEEFDVIANGSFIYLKNDIGSGDYFINFELYRGDLLRTTVSELVLVRSGLTSSKTIILVGENLKPIPVYEILIEFNEINEWELLEQNTIAVVNENKAFIIANTYSSYQWFLDGVIVSTTSSFIFNKMAGVYQLVVVVTNNEGESRSGRCRITVAPLLAENIWTNSSITQSNSEDWYSFPVTSGRTYHIWWNDVKQGDSTKTGDVSVSARYENAPNFIFGGTDSAVDSGWTSAQSFTANQNGTVQVRVIPLNRSVASCGSYSMVYSTNTVRPTNLTVTFNVNSGTGSAPASQTVNPGSSIILPDGDGLTKTGAVFNGWNANASGTGSNFNAGDSYTPVSDVTLFAKWGNTYTVTFNINGGNGTAPVTHTVNVNSNITLPGAGGLTRSGCTFGGWNTSANGMGTNYDAGTTPPPLNASVTLYARWYSTVTYDINGGSGTTPPAEMVNAGASIAPPNGSGLTRDGYTFDGWNTNADGMGTNYATIAGVSITPTGNTTLYARWIRAVNFSVNGGSGTVSGQKVPADSSITLPDGTGLTRSGYTFGGWNENTSGTGINYEAGVSFSPNSVSITLYARWIRTVTFNVNGGNGTAPIDIIVPAGSASTILPNGDGLTRSGYTFGGWSRNSDGTSPYNAGASYTPTSASDTLYARWYSTITYDLNGGSGTTPAAQTINAGSSINVRSSSGLSKSGYTFGGWNTNEDGTGANYNASTSYTPSGHITLYARWNRYVINFSVNGGTGTAPPTQTLLTEGSSIIIPSGDGLSRSGYTFDGWNENSSGTGTNYNAGDEYTPTGSTVTVYLYARWILYEYTIIYNINSGKGTTPNSQTINAGSSVILPSGDGLSRDESAFGGNVFVFDGWNTNTAGTGTNRNAGDSYTPTGNTSAITLYAKWLPIYGVNFSINGGTGTPPELQLVYGGSSIILPDGSGMSRDGYTFVGWNSRSQGIGIDYNAGSSFTPTETTLLYAKWVSITPLTTNVWTESTLTATTDEDWYSFSVVSGTTYYIWWNDNLQGDGTKTGSVGVQARYENQASFIIGSDTTVAINGWDAPRSFVAAQTGTVYVRAAPRNSSSTGTYEILYSTSSISPTYTISFNANNGTSTPPTRQKVKIGSSIILPDGSGFTKSGFTFESWNTYPSGSGTSYGAGISYTPTANVDLYAKWVMPLSANVWANGIIYEQVGDWYLFSVVSGTTYYIWWNDVGQGNGTMTGDIMVRARYANSSSYIIGSIDTPVDSGYTSARSFTANQTGTVEIIVVSNLWNVGTYGIVFSTSATRP